MTVPEHSPRSESCCFDPVYITLIMTCPNMLVTDLRKNACCFLKRLPLTAEDIYDIEVIVSELVTNAIVHARARTCRVDINVDAAHAVITVADDGAGFEPGNIPRPGTWRPNPLCFDSGDGVVGKRIGGYGLSIVRSLSESLDIIPGVERGTIVRLTKRLHPCQRRMIGKSDLQAS